MTISRTIARFKQALEEQEREAVAPPEWEETVKKMKSHPEIDNPWALCFTGDTQVALLDGRSLSFLELLSEYGTDHDFWVYSFDLASSQLVPGKARVRHSGTSVVMGVTLDTGEVVKCTPDHPWLMRDGTYKKASDLCTGDSLMPLYRKHTTGKMRPYELSFDPGVDKWVFTHQMSFWAGTRNIDYTRGFVIHHKSHIPTDNRPNNLERMTKEAHTQHHLVTDIRVRNEARQKSSASLKRLHKDPKWAAARSAKLSVSNKKTWGKHYDRLVVGVRGNLTNYNKSPEGRKQASETSIARGALDANSLERTTHAEAFRLSAVQNGRINGAKLVVSGRLKEISNLPQTKAALSARKVIGQDQEPTLAAAYLNGSTLAQLAKMYECSSGAVHNALKRIGVERRAPGPKNHKVMSVRVAHVVEDVYDLSVEEHHNFALTAGVFVHNSWYMKNKGYEPHNASTQAGTREEDKADAEDERKLLEKVKQRGREGLPSNKLTLSENQAAQMLLEKGTLKTRDGWLYIKRATTLPSRIVARFLQAAQEPISMEFPTEDAMKTYLDAHPGADKSRHHVKKPDGQAQNDNAPFHSEGTKAQARKQETQKHFDDMKALKTKVDNADPSAKKKFDRAYDKLYEQGEASAAAIRKLMPKLPEGHQEALQTALSEWDRNKNDHTKGRGQYAHEKLQQAEQTWGYASQLDQRMEDLVRNTIDGRPLPR